MSKPVLLVDFSQCVIAACAAQAADLKDGDFKGMVKHVALSMLLAWKKKFQGEIILCVDANHYWREDEFEYYKKHRKIKRDEDEFLDWKLLHETIDELVVEMRNSFPYKVIEVDGAEADDIIAVLTQYFQENEFSNTGLIEEPREIVIVSTDSDFQQLQKYRNVKQWNNVQKKLIECKNPKQFLIEHIATGDTGDNVPNIVTGAEWSKARAEGVPTRAKPFKTARFQEFYHKGIDACATEEERRHWQRNEKLIDFDFIPSHINNKIVSAYLNCVPSGSQKKIFHFLMNNKMKLLMGSISEF